MRYGVMGDTICSLTNAEYIQSVYATVNKMNYYCYKLSSTYQVVSIANIDHRPSTIEWITCLATLQLLLLFYSETFWICTVIWKRIWMVWFKIWMGCRDSRELKLNFSVILKIYSVYNWFLIIDHRLFGLSLWSDRNAISNSPPNGAQSDLVHTFYVLNEN